MGWMIFMQAWLCSMGPASTRLEARVPDVAKVAASAEGFCFLLKDGSVVSASLESVGTRRVGQSNVEAWESS